MLHFWMQGPYFLVFVFLPLVAARLIKVYKQCEMCSLMSKCFCKRALSLGSWPCQLTLYPNSVSCISGLTTRPFSPERVAPARLSPQSPHIHCSLIFCTLLPMEIIIGFTSWLGGQSHFSYTLHCGNLTEWLMKIWDFPLCSAPLGLHPRKWESTKSQEVSMAQGV